MVEEMAVWQDKLRVAAKVAGLDDLMVDYWDAVTDHLKGEYLDEYLADNWADRRVAYNKSRKHY